MSQPEQLRERTKQFALRIILLFRALPGLTKRGSLVSSCCARGRPSPPTYRTVCCGRSRAEFMAKLAIVIEEADETVFWLGLLADAGIVAKARIEG